MIKGQLLAIRHMAQATVEMADGLLASLETQAPPAPAAPPADAPCEHPAESRVDTARMGHPTAFQCRACGQEVG
jgi:hypothetical protein